MNVFRDKKKDKIIFWNMNYTYQIWIKYQTCWASDWIFYSINTKVELVTNLRNMYIKRLFHTIIAILGPLRNIEDL